MSSEAAAPAGFNRLLSDDRLTRRAVGGDQRAFAAIFRRYHQSLYRFCLAIVGNPEDAQDALQNTMIKVLRALPGEERKIDLKPWLYRIAHNESIDLLRRRRETRPLDVEQAAPGYALAEDVATRERLRRLLTDLHELPERQREVLVMRELAGLDFEEIGSALDTSGAVARQTLYEARLSLRQMEEGREMSCDAVTKALSDGDGRVTRRRDVRAHLRSCAHCRSFRDEINGRRQDLAALSPLPALAAAGMLQGLVGGSGAATGGGLAAALGGGAAKTIATSAAVKGVATVAVVAAVGVTAADRTGVIHVGLPGEGDSQSTKTAPGAAGSDPQAPAHRGSAQGVGGNGGHGKANNPAGHKGAGAVTPAPATGKTGAAHGMGHGEGHGKAHGGLQTPAPPSEHVTGQGHEKQPPEAAADGQETATEKKPEATPPSADQPEATPKPTRPVAPPPTSTPKEVPENPPAAAPEPPQQAPPSQPRSDSEEKVTGGEGPGASGTHSKAPEKTS
jgi:RNA polymerase sigma factor (sigma-70 family)